jgi:hypothetical protein
VGSRRCVRICRTTLGSVMKARIVTMPVIQRAQRVTSTWKVSRSSSAHGIRVTVRGSSSSGSGSTFSGAGIVVQPGAVALDQDGCHVVEPVGSVRTRRGRN